MSQPSQMAGAEEIICQSPGHSSPGIFPEGKYQGQLQWPCFFIWFLNKNTSPGLPTKCAQAPAGHPLSL